MKLFWLWRKRHLITEWLKSDSFKKSIGKIAKATAPLVPKAIQVVSLNKVGSNKSRKILGSPWVILPNVAEFRISLRSLDPLFAAFGIKKKLVPNIEIIGYKNGGMNRYLKHQIIRLLKYRKTNPVLYWNIAKILMKRSNVFRVAAINHVLPNWHRNYPLGFVVNANRKVSKLINKGIDKLDYSRVYIPKDKTNTRWRPLGVPTVEWRIYLHMYSNFLTFYLQPYLEHQHGYLVNKGTLSAWKEIFINKLCERKFIKEWDFENFFNSIWNNRISDELMKYNVPKDIVFFSGKH